jgi:putative MATE family efflux protein
MSRSRLRAMEHPPPPVWKQLLHLAWPVLAQQALLFAVSAYDSYLVGNNPPADPSKHIAFQAAQTNAHYLAWFISSYTVIVSVGSTALVARFTGARDHQSANTSLHQSVLLAIILGTLGSLCGLLSVRMVVRDLLGLGGEAAPAAIQFLRPLVGLLVFQVLEQAGVACLIGAGDTRTGPLVSAFVALINIPLAWCLLHGYGPIPQLGFTGVAYGTALSHMIGSVIVVGVLLRGRYGLKLHVSRLIPSWAWMYRLLRISVPAAVDSLSVVAGQFWFLSLVNQIGNESTRNFAIAAHGQAIRWEALGYLSGQAFGVAAMSLVGRNLGAGRPDRAARCGWLGLAIGGGWMCAMGAVFFALAPLMLSLFSPDEHQRRIVELGVPVLRLVAFAMPAVASTIILTAALRGAGDTRVPVLFTWVGFLAVRIPLAYLLTRDRLDLGFATISGWNQGLFGAWLAMFADLYLRGTLFAIRFARGKWKLTRV